MNPQNSEKNRNLPCCLMYFCRFAYFLTKLTLIIQKTKFNKLFVRFIAFVRFSKKYSDKWHFPTLFELYIAIRIPNLMKLGRNFNKNCRTNCVEMTLIVVSHYKLRQKDFERVFFVGGAYGITWANKIIVNL